MEHLPDDNSRYKDVDYWDERYLTEKSFEWFGDFSKFQHIFENLVRKKDAILVLGKLTTSIVFSFTVLSHFSMVHTNFLRKLSLRYLLFSRLFFYFSFLILL